MRVKKTANGLYENLDECVLAVLDAEGPLDRTSLSEILDTPRTSVYDALKRHIEAGVVFKAPARPDGTRGRPKTIFWLNPRANRNR